MASNSAANPSCSVVICTRDRPEILDRCLAALAALDYPHFEIVVVDNAPSDDRAREVALHHGARRVVESVRGLSRARNRGAQESRSELIAYLDDDAIADPGWLRGLAAEFSDPRVMAVTGRILPLRPEGDQGRMCALMIGVDGGAQRRTFDLETPAWFKSANFGGIGIGASMAVRKSAFNFWAGFNPRLGRGAEVPASEENYAFFELIAAGYRVIYTPAAVVWHHAPQDFGQLRQQHLKTLVEAGAYLAFLLAERPDCRPSVFRFIRDGVRGERRIQDTLPASARARIAPRWREVWAGIRGGLLYTRARLARRMASRS